MRILVINPPQPVVSWEDADQHLKLDGDTSQRTEVEAMIAAATGYIDGPDGWLGRAIGVQTIEARFEVASFGQSVRLPFPPLIDLVSVEYLDSDGAAQTPDVEEFEIIDDELLPVATAFPWVGGSTRREAVRVRYRAGYQELPDAIRAAILRMVGDLYLNRDSIGDRDRVLAVVERMLFPFRLFS